MLHIYNASAGSGKTFTLTQEYLRMLFQDTKHAAGELLPHSRILAVTFTKKATAEMKERILHELYILSQDPTTSQHWDVLQTKLNISAEQMQQRATLLMIGILQDYSRFSVSTIDSFFQQVIRTFARELGLSASYDLSMDGEEMIQEAVDEIFKRIKNNYAEDKDLINWLVDTTQKNLDDNEKKAPREIVFQFSKQLLSERLAQRMPELQQVFENKDFMREYRKELEETCTSMEEKVESKLQQANQIFGTISTDRWNYHLLNAFKKTAKDWLNGKIGNTFNDVLANPSKIASAKNKASGQKEESLDLYHQQLEPIFQSIIAARKNYITATETLKYLYTVGTLQDVAKQIETTNRNIGRLPISETNQLVHQIIDGQDAPFIYERYGQYFRHYMIDEFQDTSKLQWSNFSPLIHESEGNKADNLIVGDIKQSIYRFRNSDWSLLKNVNHEFHTHKEHTMGYNWRTAPVIIEENEKLMQALSQHAAKLLEEKNQQPNLGDEIQYIFAEEQMHQKAAKSTQGYFHLQYFEGKDAEEQTFDALLAQLQSLQQEGIDLKRVTLLVRYNSQATTLANFLISHGYNVQSSEGLKIGAHPTIQLIINLLKQAPQKKDENEKDDKKHQLDEISLAYIKQHFGDLYQEQQANILRAQQLPLYEQVQFLIDTLQLAEHENVGPYLTALQDIIYQFCQNRVADRQSFLEYWERKGKNKTIAAPRTTNAIQIMSIHSSKGLEFDIVIIPFFTWELYKTHREDILWCEPKTPPFNKLPLVAVHPNDSLLKSHFREEYIQERLLQHIDNLNLTYVAITRPKYRLYIYGQIKSAKTPNYPIIGREVYKLYKDRLDDQLTYRVPAEGVPAPLPPLEEDTTHIHTATYISSPINDRLVLRSRAEDDFTADTPLETVDLGILMHLWLSQIRTWQDAEPALTRLIRRGQVTEQQAVELRKQFNQFQSLILRENHDEWFSDQYTILSEQDIITPSGNMQRPDRVMIKDKHAIVIDYKFGNEQRRSYLEQVRDYMSLLNQMGYTTEGYIIYNALQIIHSIPV